MDRRTEDRLRLDQDRFVSLMKQQAQIGATETGGLHRTAISDADRAVRDWLLERMEALGLEVRIDEFGNMFGRTTGANPNASPILVGSHLDSQPNGGIYDGALGVISALELIHSIDEWEVTLEHPIEIVNWTNEEGTRFQPAMQGSGVWSGVHDIEREYQKTDAEGNRLEDELERIGYLGSSPAAPQEEYRAYLELHIEQGPSLEENETDIGVVTGIVGSRWGEIVFHGEANHAGPTPMHQRRDPLFAAADVITKIRQLSSSLGEQVVATTGRIDVEPNSINVIPAKASFTWDVRDIDDATVDEAAQLIRKEAKHVAEREGLDWEINEHMQTTAVEFDDACIDAVGQAADKLGYSSMPLTSGAGHDAIHLSTVTDTGMVFAVSEDGTSHTEAEYTSWDDCYKAASVLANAAIILAET